MNATAEVRYLQPIQFDQIETRFDAEFGVYWAMMNPRPRPCFNPQLLHEFRSFIDGIINSDAAMYPEGKACPVNYAVLSSKAPGVFNLGGDLALFRSAIVHRDRSQLENYARLCVDILYPWNRNFDLPVTTISLVQGSALGGGFEAALASNIIIAEESSRMGFPEVLFNLFPGMGAYSFLQRKVGRRVTDDLITSGNTYTARELYDMGVVDVITPDGTGEAAVYSYVRRHARGGRGRRAYEQVRREFEAVTHEELDRVAQMWVEAAIKLEERDLKMMDRLVRAQQRTAMENSGSYDPDAPPVQGRLAAVGGGDD